MNAKDMQRAFYSWKIGKYETVVPNAFVGRFEMDLAAIRSSGLLEEIEIKISKYDFQKDFKKAVRSGELKHDLLREGKLPCNYFSFLIPKEFSLVDSGEA